MPLTLNLPDDLMKKLEEQAKHLNTSVESLAELKLRAAMSETTSQQLADSNFETLARGVINDNRELLERLAK